MNQIRELFGLDCKNLQLDFRSACQRQICPYTEKPCSKTRKADPEIKSGICSVQYQNRPVIICPNRFLDQNTIFKDCLGLLNDHQKGNRLYLVPEFSIPGGQLDFVLVSLKEGVLVDLAGIEIQSADTTGTLWAARQAFLKEAGIEIDPAELKAARPFGINWKMSLKTILVQMLHKAEIFETIQKPLVLVLQEPLLERIKTAFNFQGLETENQNGLVYLFSYTLLEQEHRLMLSLKSCIQTSSQGLKACLGLNREKEITLSELKENLIQKLCPDFQLKM